MASSVGGEAWRFPRKSPLGPCRSPPCFSGPVLAGNLAAPGAGLSAGLLDELLEVLHIALDRHVVDADSGADLLRQALRLPVKLHRHAGLCVIQLVESDDARVVLFATNAVPGDSLIGKLLNDFRVELPLDTADLDLPVREGVADLFDVLDEAEEVGEGLELSPLVVRGGDRYVHVD